MSATLLLVGCGASGTPTPQPESISIQLPTPTPAPESAGVGSPLLGGGEVDKVFVRALSTDPDSLNPLLSTNRAGAAVINLLYPVLFNLDPMTGQPSPNGAMAERWEVSQDGLTYTFYLRPNVTWSDGDPVDAADFKFTYDLLADDRVDSPNQGMTADIARIEVLDPLTVSVQFNGIRCDALSDLRLRWLPSHLFTPGDEDFIDRVIADSFEVSAGPFLLQSWTPRESVALERNETYWQGAPAIERMVLRIMPDPADRYNGLLDGSLDAIPVTAAQANDLAGNPGVTVHSANIDGYDFIAVNLANPENPQAGRDEAGALIVQDPHPALSDPAVRQAIAYALDYTTIVESIYLNHGYQIASNALPVIPWAHNTQVQPYTYDPNRARQLLEEAGWIDSNSDGVREKGLASLYMNLLTTSSNNQRAALAGLIQDQLNSVGFDITVQEVDSTDLVKQLLAQTYDLAVFGWAGLGSDPNDELFWSTRADQPGSGFNFVSYQNTTVENLLAQANSLPGCKPEDRAPIYREVQQILHDELPYIFLVGATSDTAYSNHWGGIAPGPWDFYWNVQEWRDVNAPKD
ncbi:MAG: hypothetical protein IPK16_34020 [Anaerolineales bacterium]|nr:hypothetical protein [Anaerolineales bacterium]